MNDPRRPASERAAGTEPGHKNGRDDTTELILNTLREPGTPVAEVESRGDAATAAPAVPPRSATRPIEPEPAVPALPRKPRPRPRRTWAGWERLSRLLLAFTIASLLWVYVLNLENPSGSSTYSRIPVVARGLDKNLSLGNDLGSVTITAQAPADVLSGLRSSDFTAYIDLAGKGPGTYRVPVQVAAPGNTDRVSVEPAQIQVQIIEVSERRMSVQVRPNGRPGLGYQIETQQVRPAEVLVRGPRDQVERIDQVVAEVDVENKQGTQAGEVAPQALDFAGREITGLEFQPQYVNVVVAIQLVVNYKTLPVHAPVEGAPAPGYVVTDITVQPTTLTAYGPPNVLEPLNFLETAPVSIGGATQTVQVNMTVPLTNGLTLYPPTQHNQVEVRVVIEELSTKTRLSAQVTHTGLSPGLVSVESPDRIDITVSGPFDALQDLKPDSVRAVLDLTGYGVGTYRLTPAITVPPRTTLRTWDPQEITVTISGPPTVLPEPTLVAPPVQPEITPSESPEPSPGPSPSPAPSPSPGPSPSPAPTVSATPPAPATSRRGGRDAG
jgi:YbbR domain-containing protein